MAGGLVGVWGDLWQWVAGLLASDNNTDTAKGWRSSFIDPNG